MDIGGIEIYNEDILKVLVAVLLGTIIGLEREWRGKPAGLRTLALVSAGSAIFTILSHHMGVMSNGPESDITRIASNIVTGVGFLGAGIIFRGNNQVKGLTTAATVWVSAAIGMAAGSGNYSIAVVSTVIVWVVLVLMQNVEILMTRFSETLTYRVSFHEAHNAADIHYKEYFPEKGYRLDVTKYDKKAGAVIVYWTVSASRKKHGKAIDRLLNDDKVIELEYN